MKITDSHNRLKELLETSGDTQADMVRKTGIEKSAISNYINGKREARQDKLIQIANAYNVNPAWLMGLDVPKHSMTDEEKLNKANELFTLYENATPEVRAAVETILKSAQRP